MIALTATLSSADGDIDGVDVIVDVMLMIWWLDIDDLVVCWFSSVIALMFHLSCLAEVVRKIILLFAIQLLEYQTDMYKSRSALPAAQMHWRPVYGLGLYLW